MPLSPPLGCRSLTCILWDDGWIGLAPMRCSRLSMEGTKKKISTSMMTTRLLPIFLSLSLKTLCCGPIIANRAISLGFKVWDLGFRARGE
mmetsp:Transcript_9777/g.15739  ORF Transcript_9777/g.15739 Transcript_9777/m.15739 type:complete len:90 (-) Transcript_9777:754-1023(-)